MKKVKFLPQVDETKCLKTKIDQEKCTPSNVPYCQAACPLHIDIRGYVSLIHEGKFSEALKLIKEKLPFPAIVGRICSHPCESKCKRQEVDEAVAIAALKRATCDYAEGIEDDLTVAEEKDKKVAIVGGGPAGLMAAYDLRKLGYQVTIFEAMPVLGGMLAVGIPECRLPRDILQTELRIIPNLGVEVRLNTRVGQEVKLSDLGKEFDTVFLAIGTNQGRKLGIENEESKGVVDGVEFLRQVNLGDKVKVRDRVLIVGGGNVAVDCARTCLRLGFGEVAILYRRSREEMPAMGGEVEKAEEEGVKIIFLATPVKVLNKNGEAIGLECLRMELGEPDASGRRRPIPIEGSEFVLESDLIISAIGEQPDFSFLDGETSLASKDGLLLVTPLTLETSLPGIFAGGDAVTGPSAVIDALASGKKAAISVDRYIRGEDLTVGREGEEPYESSLDMDVEDIAPRKRFAMPTLNIDQRRGNFREVELGFKKEEAIEEAGRCLSCDCYRCQNICPTEAITTVEKKTTVDEKVCLACCKCWDICLQDAIKMVLRPEPITFGLDPREMDQTKLKELCIKAHLHPRQLLCLCSSTRVDEVAAAVLKGAKSPKEISLMTGASSGCGLYCMEPMLRLLKAHGVEVTPPEGHRYYNIIPTLWDITMEVEEKHPGYYLKEDKKVFRKV